MASGSFEDLRNRHQEAEEALARIEQDFRHAENKVIMRTSEKVADEEVVMNLRSHAVETVEAIGETRKRIEGCELYLSQ